MTVVSNIQQDLKCVANVDLIHYAGQETMLAPNKFNGLNRIFLTNAHRHFHCVSVEKLIPISNAHKAKTSTSFKHTLI